MRNVSFSARPFVFDGTRRDLFKSIQLRNEPNNNDRNQRIQSTIDKPPIDCTIDVPTTIVTRDSEKHRIARGETLIRRVATIHTIDRLGVRTETGGPSILGRDQTTLPGAGICETNPTTHNQRLARWSGDDS